MDGSTGPAHARVRAVRPRIFHLTLVIGGFTALRVVLWIAGLRFQDRLIGQLQLIDEPLLADDPFRAFTSLHIQPPLWNFIVGAVRAWSPLPDAFSFQVIWFVASLGTMCMLWAILAGSGARRWQATAATLLVASHPLVVQNEAVLRYETLAVFLVTASVYTFMRVVDATDSRRIALFVGVLTVGVLTRSILQPAWLLGGIVFAMFLARRRGMLSRRVVAIGLLPLVLIGGDLVVHQVRFGTLGYSSYASENLKRVAVTTLPGAELDRLQSDRTFSAFAALKPYSPYAVYAGGLEECPTDGGEPALRELTKSTGEPNLNSVCFLPVYRTAMGDAVAAIRARPGNFARMLGHNAVIFASWPVAFDDHGVPAVDVLEDLYRPLLLPVHLRHDIAGDDPQSFVAFVRPGLAELPFLGTMAIALLASLWWGGRGAVRMFRKVDDGPDVIRVWIGFTVLAIGLLGVILEFPENARQREALDPILLGPLFVAVFGAVRAGIVRLRTAGAGRLRTPDGPTTTTPDDRPGV